MQMYILQINCCTDDNNPIKNLRLKHEPHYHFGLVSVEEGVRNEPLVMDTYIMYFDKHHFNMENRFVINPDKTIIAVPCNNHNPDKKNMFNTRCGSP